MNVNDVLYQHIDIVNIAEGMGSKTPEDIAQNVWIKLMEMEERNGDLDNLEHEGRLGYHAIRYMVKNEIRIERKEQQMLDLDVVDNLTKVDVVIPEEEIRLEEALGQLSKEDRDLFYRYAVDEDTQAEISDDLGVSQSTVARRIEKVRKFLCTKIDISSKNN